MASVEGFDRARVTSAGAINDFQPLGTRTLCSDGRAVSQADASVERSHQEIGHDARGLRASRETPKGVGRQGERIVFVEPRPKR